MPLVNASGKASGKAFGKASKSSGKAVRCELRSHRAPRPASVTFHSELHQSAHSSSGTVRQDYCRSSKIQDNGWRILVFYYNDELLKMYMLIYLFCLFLCLNIQWKILEHCRFGFDCTDSSKLPLKIKKGLFINFFMNNYILSNISLTNKT